MSRIDKNRIGERRLMKCGEEAEIIEYKKYDDITIKFKSSGELVKCRYSEFKKRAIKSHFRPTVYEFGVVGLEKTKENGKHLKSYEIWRSMLKRCYDKKEQKRYPRYEKCSVCDEWKYYKNFKEWYEDNYYEVEGQRMHLDKDILVKGNKIYSPETCVFVPERINILFIKSNKIRGDYPIGVNWHERDKIYESGCSIFDTTINKNKRKYLGRYSTPEEAFQVYKQFKENYIKQIADYYKEQIPEKLYNAMYNYKVEITD